MKNSLGELFRLLGFCAVMKKGFLFALLIGSVGCGSVGQVSISDQRLVSKPNMLFSQSGVFIYQNRLIAQIEPGSAASGGGQAAGCTSCK
ncbi:MAG: hypothetical protein CMO63_04170 [Verrucomicrobiales bacterium]|nr:hypothetical protein [Verrucomicrobiales bacterium]